MKFGILKVLVTGFFLAVFCAFAPLREIQAQDHDHDHDHNGQAHDHDHAPEKRKGNSVTDKLWVLSDKAFHDGDYPKAILYHRQIVELDPKDIQSFSVAAWLMWSLGQNQVALKHIERGLKVNGNHWEMWDEAGQHYQLQAGRDLASPLVPRAKEAFMRSVQLLPADADKNEAMMLRRRLAHAADKADDLELSLATWKKLVEDYPDDVVNKNNMARVERKLAEKQAEQENESKRKTAAYIGGGAAFLAFIGAGAMMKHKSRSAMSTPPAASSQLHA